MPVCWTNLSLGSRGLVGVAAIPAPRLRLCPFIAVALDTRPIAVSLIGLRLMGGQLSRASVVHEQKQRGDHHKQSHKAPHTDDCLVTRQKAR